MTAGELATLIVEDWHDWIDGDDWPVEIDPGAYWKDGAHFMVTFASGRVFQVEIIELEPVVL